MTSSPTTGDTALDVTAAAHRLTPHIRATPLLRTHIDGHPVTFKLEQLQLTGAFKIRGALNALLAGPTPTQVVTASGGNHGLGVATAARILDIPAVVYVPDTVPEAKARRLRATGADLRHVGQHYAEAATAAHTHATRTGTRYIHAYDDPHVVAGQGTIGVEITAAAPDCDAIVVAVGGGGLLAGVSLAVAGHTTTPVGVEPHGCHSLHAALAAHTPVDTPVDSVASSALGATRLGTVPFQVLTRHRPTTVLVSDSEILAARDRLWEETRIACEPAAAAPLAAWLAGRVPAHHPCLVVCGANTDWTPHP